MKPLGDRLRLDAPEIDPPEHLVHQLADLARRSTPTPPPRRRRPVAVLAATAGAVLLSVGGAWATGTVTLPGLPQPHRQTPTAPGPASPESTLPAIPAPSAPSSVPSRRDDGPTGGAATGGASPEQSDDSRPGAPGQTRNRPPERTQPVRPARPTKPPKPIQPTKPPKPTKPTKPAKPSKPPRTAQPQVPGETTGPDKTVRPSRHDADG